MSEVQPLYYKCVCVCVCVCFPQQAFNAASVIHHMKKLQLSHSDSAPSTLSMPNIIVRSSSQDHLNALGPCHDEAAALDPNGKTVATHLSCSNPESGRVLCPQLRPSHSEPRHALTAKESREVHTFTSASDASLRPSRR